MSNSCSDADSVLEPIRSTLASIDALQSGQNHPGAPQVAACLQAEDTSKDLWESVHTETAHSVLRPVMDRFSEIQQNRSTEGPCDGSECHAVAEHWEDSTEESADNIEFCSLPPADEEADASAPLDHFTDSVIAEAVSLRAPDKNARIMIVDDEPLTVMTFRQHLVQEGYSQFIASSDSSEALDLVRKERPDIVLLDINMPRVSGLEILQVMGLDPALRYIPVLVLTASTDPQIRRTALDLGASDFLTKPVDPSELLPRVRNAVILKQHFDMVASEAARLEQQVERRTRQLEATRQQLILSLARAAEHRDNDTGNHVLRVGRYTAIIAQEMGYPKKRLSMLEQAAQLHDVGKIGIPDSILFKPGRLDHDEYELIKKHCALGRQIIEPISDKDWAMLKTHTRRGESLLHVSSSPLLMLAARIAQTHHEKWDGSGYPLGLSGEDIPLEGRIVAVADVYDALSSTRPYKKPFSREKCFEILKDGRGSHFDPAVVDAFMQRSGEIIETQLVLMDEEARVTGSQYADGDSQEATGARDLE